MALILPVVKREKKKEEEAAAKATQTSAPIKPATPELAPELTPEEKAIRQREAGNAYVRAREKALSQGASRQEANTIANNISSGIGQDAYNPAVVQQQKQLVESVGQLTPEQQNREIIQGEGWVDTVQIAQGTGAGAIAGGGAGFAAGSALAPFTAGLSIPVLTAGGIIVGGIGGYYATIAYDKTQDVKQARVTGTTAYSNMNYFINQANKGMNKQEAVAGFNEATSLLYASEETLKRETQGKIGRELSRATDELARIQSQINQVPGLQLAMQQAILNPNPNIVYDTRMIDEEANK